MTTSRQNASWALSSNRFVNYASTISWAARDACVERNTPPPPTPTNSKTHPSTQHSPHHLSTRLSNCSQGRRHRLPRRWLSGCRGARPAQERRVSSSVLGGAQGLFLQCASLVNMEHRRAAIARSCAVLLSVHRHLILYDGQHYTVDRDLHAEQTVHGAGK